MSSVSPEEVISVLKSESEGYDTKTEALEVGSVISIGDGIATVYGIEHAMYGELVEFANGTTGIVQNLNTKTVGVVLMGTDKGIQEGTKVTRTKKQAGVPVGDKMIGRVVNALGEPIDGKGAIETTDFFPVEAEAPGVLVARLKGTHSYTVRPFGSF